MNAQELIEFCDTVIKHSEVLVFASVDEEGYPQTRTMFNLKNSAKFPSIENVVNIKDNPFHIIFGTNTASAKVEELRKNPKASVHYSLPEQFKSVTISGAVEIIDDLEFKKSLWIEGWEMYYPSGYEDPDYCVLTLHPTLAHGWYGSGKFRFGIKPEQDDLAKRYNIITL